MIHDVQLFTTTYKNNLRIVQWCCIFYLGQGSTVSNNRGATSKFEEPERWHEASSILRTHNSWVTYEPHCYLARSARCMWNGIHFICKRQTTAIIILKIVYSTVQNLVTCATRRLGSLSHWLWIQWNTSRHMPTFCLPYIFKPEIRSRVRIS
jgi:hypothetical protein